MKSAAETEPLRPTQSRTADGTWLTTATRVAWVMWAIGSGVDEGLALAAAYLMMVLCVAGWRRLNPAADVRRWAWLTAAFAAWQSISPIVSKLRGVADAWPRSGRYGQFVDALAAPAAALMAQWGVPWKALSIAAGAVWIANVWVGAFQHFVGWPFGQPFWSKTPIARVHENFSSPDSPAYGAGGFLFHRLRFAHGAVGVLGPTLAWLTRGQPGRAFAGVLTVHLMLAPYLGFARAALAVAAIIFCVAILTSARGRARVWLPIILSMLLFAVVANPDWRQRLLAGVGNVLGGDRQKAMAAGWQLVRQHPFLGVGFGNHQSAALATSRDGAVTAYLATDSHNLLLTIWAETGLLGLGLYLSSQVAWLRAAVTRTRLGSVWAYGGLLAWLAFQLLGLVHYLPYHTGVHLTFAAIFALALSENPSSQIVAAQLAGYQVHQND